MSFYAFALGVAAVFFVSSLIMLNWGRYIGLQSLHHQHPDDIAALSTVENAVFALIGLLLAFTISGALQRFDERRGKRSCAQASGGAEGLCPGSDRVVSHAAPFFALAIRDCLLGPAA